MAVPSSRAEFKEYCLRKLGKPVIEINVDDDQVDDRIDEALKYFWDYHFDGSEKVYYKYRINGSESSNAINNIVINSGGSGYSNSQTVTFTGGSGASANVSTFSNGTIKSLNFTSYGTGYTTSSAAVFSSNTGSGANLSITVGDGAIILPDNIIGAVRVFPIGDPTVGTNDMFSIRYQIALNDLYTLTSVSMVPYYMVMQHLALIQEILVGQQPIRYNRHRNRLYIDMDWSKMKVGDHLLVEAYEVVNPDIFTDAWGDRWLQEYATAKIKYQWGTNLTKFTGMQLPGGVQFNGEKILDDAKATIDKLEESMINNYSLPVYDMIG
jgi:hypothetical protein